jgi:hypothetical protein
LVFEPLIAIALATDVEPTAEFGVKPGVMVMAQDEPGASDALHVVLLLVPVGRAGVDVMFMDEAVSVPVLVRINMRGFPLAARASEVVLIDNVVVAGGLSTQLMTMVVIFAVTLVPK